MTGEKILVEVIIEANLGFEYGDGSFLVKEDVLPMIDDIVVSSINNGVGDMSVKSVRIKN